VVIATDFSELSRCALDAGKRMAKGFGSRVSLVHAHQLMAPVAAYPGVFWNAELDAQMRADERKSLDALHREQFADFDGVSAQLLEHPNAAVAICDYAAECAAELIVVGTHGRTGLGHFLIGSVAEAVARHAPCAVMAVRPAFELARFPEHLLVCTDFSPASTPALEAAAELARIFEPRVTLLHVYPDPPSLPGIKTKPYRALEHVDADLR
jgi:nucleotide-binding universal stress UspA family protein